MQNLPLFPPLLYVGLGVDRSFPPEPHEIIYMLDKPITIGNTTCDRMCLDIYSYDPTLAPPGKTALVAFFYADFDYWQKLRLENREQYKQEKEKAADQVIAFLDTRFPGLAKQVEMRDVATPATWERYTGNWRGAWEGWMLTEQGFHDAYEQRATRPEKLLYGRPVGGAGRRHAGGSRLGTECNSDYLQAGRQKIYHHKALGAETR